ncbi:MAG: hypothetical protein ACPL6F_02185 [Anaerolineales bacterium]|uniref:hypothetical protein n=1 Tax=Rectinema subterraneum TaxID=2653714 RepID=UPI003C7BA9C3
MKIILPSYQEPGTWLENAQMLDPQQWVDGIELLFFSYDDDAQAILKKELPGLRDLAARFSYSLHMPDPLSPKCEELIEATSDFVSLYIFHPLKSSTNFTSDKEQGQKNLEHWAGLVTSFQQSFQAERFAMEFTDLTSFQQAEHILKDCMVCADTGALLRYGIEPSVWYAKYSSRITEIHLHSIRNDKDHYPLSKKDEWLCPLLAEIEKAMRPDTKDSKPTGKSPLRINLETFALEDSKTSYWVLMEGRCNP